MLGEILPWHRPVIEKLQQRAADDTLPALQWRHRNAYGRSDWPVKIGVSGRLGWVVCVVWVVWDVWVVWVVWAVWVVRVVSVVWFVGISWRML